MGSGAVNYFAYSTPAGPEIIILPALDTKGFHLEKCHAHKIIVDGQLVKNRDREFRKATAEETRKAVDVTSDSYIPLKEYSPFYTVFKNALLKGEGS